MRHALCALSSAAACTLLCAGVEFVELHGPDGQKVYVNEHEISTLREPTSFDTKRYFPHGVHCVVVTTNSRFIATQEACDVIRSKVTGQ